MKPLLMKVLFAAALSLILTGCNQKKNQPSPLRGVIDAVPVPSAPTPSNPPGDSNSSGTPPSAPPEQQTPAPNPNPSPNPPPVGCTVIPGTVAPGTISINQGAAWTSSTSVQIQVQYSEATHMRISPDDECRCGTWENYAATKGWTLTALNQYSNFSVQFRDYEGRFSACAKASILHDDQPPVIAVSLDSANSYESGSDVVLNLQVTDAGSGVASRTCLLNGAQTNCNNNRMTFSSLAPGFYKFSVTASDNVGLSSSKDISWTVLNPLRPISQDYLVKADNNVDILLIVDNSQSMEYEQKSMALRMSTFLRQLAGLDWRIAITTTDPRATAVGGDGQLLEMTGLKKQTFIDSKMNSTTAQKALESTIQRPEIGSNSEQGINATYRSIERALDPNDNPGRRFFRNNAHFAAVVISDEDESDTKFKNIPDNLLRFVKTSWPDKNFAFHSIITKSGDTNCKDTYGATYGVTYERMSRLTGAGMIGGPIIGSVCEPDYGSQLRGIGDSVQTMQRVIQLQCPPLGPANSSVLVSRDGQNVTTPYTVQADRIVFDSNLQPGKYTLKYSCR